MTTQIYKHIKYIRQKNNRMGTICANIDNERCDKTEEPNRNYKLADVDLGSFCKIEIINGLYQHHQSETLLVLAEPSKITNSQELEHYCTDLRLVTANLLNKKKILTNVPMKKDSPYKKLVLCCLPKYESNEGEFYQQQIMSIFAEVLQSHTDITLQMNPTSESTQRIGNQYILALLFRQILNCVSSPFRLCLVSEEAKTLNLFRFQLMKTEKCSSRVYTSH